MSGSERQPEGSPKGRGVFHKTRLSDIPRQRLHKAINCLVEAQPTNAALQSLTLLHKLRRLAELRKSPDFLRPQPTDRPPQSSRKIGLREAGRLAEPLRFADANHLPFQGRQKKKRVVRPPVY